MGDWPRESPNIDPNNGLYSDVIPEPECSADLELGLLQL